MKQIGTMLLVMGGLLMLAGLLFVLGVRIPFLGRLPGDIHYRGERASE